MRIPKLNLRKKRGRKSGSPLKNDPTLVTILSRLPTINDLDSFETWRRVFLERLGYFLVEEGIEKSEEVYNVTLRVKVDKLVRIISKIAHHVNEGNLSSKHVTIQSRNSLLDGMKSCEDISTYLKVLSPLNLTEEKIVGYTKYNTAAVLVETSFKEYERLNMCRDILQVLRENFVNSVAEPQHIAAFDKFDAEMSILRSVFLEDVGLLPVLKKQRQLKSPDPPKSLIAEIRRGVLREALISKSLEAKQATQAGNSEQLNLDSNASNSKPKVDRGKVDSTQKNTQPSQELETSPGTDKPSVSEAVDPENSIVDGKQDVRSTSLASRNRLENLPANETNKSKKRRKKVSSKSPLKRRPTTNSSRRPLKQSVDDTLDTKRSRSLPRRRKKSKSPKRKASKSPLKQRKTSKSPLKRRQTANSPRRPSRRSEDDALDTKRSRSLSRRRKKSKSPKRDSSDPGTKISRPPSRRRGAKNPVSTENRNGDGLSTSVQMLSSQNRSTSSNKTSKSKSHVSQKKIPEEHSVQQPIVHDNEAGYQKSEILAIYSKPNNLSKSKHSEDDKSISSIHRKNNSKVKAKKVRKGRQSLKTSVRERNLVTARRGREALHKKEFSVNTPSGVNDTSKELLVMKGEDYKFENLNQNLMSDGTFPTASKAKKIPRNPRHQKHTNPQRARAVTTETGKIIDRSLEIIFDEPNQGKGTHKKKKMLSSTSKPKKNPLTTDDYKKIIHGKAYAVNAKKELPKLCVKRPFPVLVSDDVYLQELSTPTEKTLVDPTFAKLQLKSGVNLSSSLLSSLLDDCRSLRSLSSDQDDSKIFQYTTPKEVSHLLYNAKFQRCKSAPTIFENANVQNEGKATKSADFYGENDFERPSFYANYIEPLTMMRDEMTDKSEGKVFRKDEERWEWGKDIFEDSVCSSKYKSGNSSIAEAVAKFNPEGSIIELQRLNKIRKEKDEAMEVKNKGVTEDIEKSYHSFFETNEEYSVYDHIKEILTVEEEAARMADELAKLQIALKDNQDVLDFTGLECEDEQGKTATDKGTWKFTDGKQYQMAENMPKLEISEFKLRKKSNGLGGNVEKGNKATDETSWDELFTSKTDLYDKEEYLVEVGEKLKTAEKTMKLDTDENDPLANCIKNDEDEKFRDKNEKLDITEKMLKLEINEDEMLRNCDDDADNREEKNEPSNDGTWQFREEELEMAEKMLELEACKDEVIEDNVMTDDSIFANHSNVSSFKRTKRRQEKAILPSMSVRVYDPSARLSRWKTPSEMNW